MKCLYIIEDTNLHAITITVEESRLFGLIKTRCDYSSFDYEKGRILRSWLKEPDKTLVGFKMSIQLDMWFESSGVTYIK